MKKTLATTTAIAAALGGVVTGAVFTAGPAAVAQEADATTTTEATTESLVERATASIREALAGLVDEGVIDEAQADAVAETLAENAPGRRGPRHGRGFALADSSALTDLLGMEASDLFEALADGATLAEVAEAQGVDADAVADLLVAEAQERLDAAVESGHLDEAAADKRAANIDELIDGLLNGELPLRGQGFRGEGFRDGSGVAPDSVGTDTSTS